MTPAQGKGNWVTLGDALSHWATVKPAEIAFRFLADGSTESQRLSFADLDLRARAIAASLQQRCQAGDRALLLYPPGLEFVCAFFACLYSGVLAVPAYPPRPNRKRPRAAAIQSSCQARLILTTTSAHSIMTRPLEGNPELADLECLSSDKIEQSAAAAWEKPELRAEDPAFLQYTSGSSGDPKGVIVTHFNLLANAEVMQASFGHDEQAVMLTWQPHFHDMGLIGCVLQAVYQGARCVLMPPLAFYRKPALWLQAISRYRATFSGGPNSAYALCNEKVAQEDLEGLDLTCWKCSVNGAEPLFASTLQRFARAFSPWGFKWKTLVPAYGLAENTLLVSGGPADSDPVLMKVEAKALELGRISKPGSDEKPVTLVGCGRIGLGQRAVVADPETLRACAPGQVGEIWLSGGSVAKGYWNLPKETEEAFGARLADTGQGPFLRSGDLGFMQEGELFVVGRLKDLIIIRGRNHHPQDIELTTGECHESLRGTGAAFSLEIAEEERLVVVQEVERTALRHLKAEEVISAIRQAVSEEHDLQVHAVQLLKPGSIPHTSSGKIQRRLCRQRFLDGKLNAVAEWRRQVSPVREAQPSGRRPSAMPDEASLRGWLVQRLSSLAQVSPDELAVDEPFSRYGMDSASAIELAGQLEDFSGRPCPPTLMYDYPTIELLARQLSGPSQAPASRAAKGAATPLAAEPVAVIGLGCRFPGADSPSAFWRLLCEARDAVREAPAERRRGWESWGTRFGKGGYLDQIDAFDAGFFSISASEACAMDPQQRLLMEVCWEALEDAGHSPEALKGSDCGVFVGISANDYLNTQALQGATDNPHQGTGNAFSIAANRLSYFFDFHGPSWAVDTACSSSLVAVHQAIQSLRLGECGLALAGGVNVLLNPAMTSIFAQAGMLAPDGCCKSFDASANGYVRSEGCGLVVLKPLSQAVADRDRIYALIRGSAVNQDGRSNGLTAPNGPSQKAVVLRALANAGANGGEVEYVEAHGTGTALGDPIEVNSLVEVLSEGRPPDRPCRLGSVKANIGHLESAAGVAGLIKAVLALHHNEIPPQIHFKALNPEISLEGKPYSIPIARTPLMASGRWLAGISSFGFGGTNAHLIVERAAVEEPSPEPVAGVRVVTLSALSEGALQAQAQRLKAHLGLQPSLTLPDIAWTLNAGRCHFSNRLAAVAESIPQLCRQLAAFAEGKTAPGIVQGIARPQEPKVAFLFKNLGRWHKSEASSLFKAQPAFRQALGRCERLIQSRWDCSLLGALSDEEHSDGSPDAPVELASFALHYALAELWKSWGIRPAFLLGLGDGEYSAACQAGVFSLEAGIALLAESLQQGEGSSAPDLTAPRIPIVSSQDGSLDQTVWTDLGYWKRPSRQPLHLDAALKTLRVQGAELLLEIGPFPVLTDLAKRESAEADSRPAAMLETLAKLYVGGASVDWQGVHAAAPCRRVSLPTYPFQRKRYWYDMPLGVEKTEADRPSRQEGLSAPKQASLPKVAAAELGWVYRVRWEPVARQHAPGQGEPGIWILLAHPDEMALQLRSRLEGSAKKCILVQPGGSFEARDSGYWRADSLQPGHFDRLIEEASQLYPIPIEGIVHLWGLGEASAEAPADDLIKAQQAGCAAALHLVQALVVRQSIHSPKIWMATRGVLGWDRIPSSPPIQAPLWGLGRVIALEHPQLWGGLVDFSTQESARQRADCLWAELLDSEGEDQIAFREGRRHCARLVPHRLSPASMPDFQADASYWIVGGLGALGLETAGWLIDRGARSLVLTGRSRPSESTATQLRQWEDQGVRITLASADVASLPDLKRIAEKIDQELPPLRGIVQAAGVTDDGALHRQSWPRFEKVMASKVQGSWNLHLLSQDRELDFFVLFSSAASLLGNAGQANYAAANAFQDALAGYRASLRLSALSVNWGPWETGIAARMAPQGGSRLLTKVFQPLKAEQGFQLLGQLLQTGLSQLAVLPADWSVYRALAPGHLPLLSELSPQSRMPSDGGSAAHQEGLREKLLQQPKNQRFSTLRHHLEKELSTLLGHDLAQVSHSRKGFFEMGLDSLTAMALRNRLESALGVALSATLILEYSNVEALVKHLEGLVVSEQETPHSSPSAVPEEADDAASLAEISRLGADELEAYINQELESALHHE